MVLDYDRRPEASVDRKIQTLMESVQLALNDIARAQESADVAKDDAQTSVSLAETARTAANEASDSARTAKQAADEATAAVEEIEGDVSGLTTRVAQAETDIDAAEGSIVALGTRVGTAETNITNIEGNVTSLAGRVSDAEDDINAVEGDITSLQSDVSTAQGNITTIQGNLTSLTGRVSAAEGDITTVEGDITSLQGRVSDAEDDVEDVMKGLSLAENVVGTLNWITAHSTVTTDTTPQAGTTYYIKHLDGTYEIVTDTTGKNPAQEGWYVLDEALQNYVLSHLSLTDDGLYVMADGSKWKVKISDDGVYIIDGTSGQDKVVAKYKDVITLGMDNNTESYQRLDYHSLQLIGRGESKPYFWVSDLRDKDDDYQATITEKFKGDGIQNEFDVSLPVSEEVSAVDSENPLNTAIRSDSKYTFTHAPTNGAIVTIVYKTRSNWSKAYTFGYRLSTSKIGALSVAEGYNATASGNYSHAEGGSTTASGSYSHAEGISTTASGNNSHAEGSNTTASGSTSHAEGYIATASGSASHAEGYSTTASGRYSHAEGFYTTASDSYSHAEGFYTTASGNNSHAEGCDTTASGSYSHAQNLNTTANGFAQTAIGQYNDNQSDNLFEIGNGTSDSDRSNAFAVDWRGEVDSFSSEYERGVGGSMNAGYNLTDKNGDSFAYMKGIVTLDSQDRPIEGFNIGTNRVVGGSTKWNSLRLQIDADGNPVVVINQPAAWKNALGFDSIITDEFTIDNISIDGSATSGAQSVSVAKSGYTPLMIQVSLANASSDGKNVTGCVAYSQGLSGNTARVNIANRFNSAAKVKATITVLYKAN